MKWPPWSKNGRPFPKWWLIVAAGLAVVALLFGYPGLLVGVVASIVLLLIGVTLTRRALICRNETWQRGVAIGFVLAGIGFIAALVTLWNLILVVTGLFF